MDVRQAQLIRAAIRGAAAIEVAAGGVGITRLPPWTRAQFGPDAENIEFVSRQPSGVRLDLLADGTCIDLGIRCLSEPLGQADRTVPPIAAVVSGREVDVVLDGSGGVYSATIALGAAATRRVEIWLPHDRIIELTEVRSDAALRAAPRDRPRWTHYGSSISHCVEADGPLGVWPAIAARALGLDLYSLGLGGQAQLDPFSARAIAQTPADVISLKVGINVVGSASLTRRSFVPAVHGFLDTIRDSQPFTPMLLISPIICPVHEFEPGPSTFDVHGLIPPRHDDAAPAFADGLTLAWIREQLRLIVDERNRDDGNLHYLSGLELLGESDIEHLADGLHPSAEGYRLMGERFIDHVLNSPLLVASP